MKEQAPILDYFSDEGLINKETYIENQAKDFENLHLIKDKNIDTCLLVFVKSKNMPDDILKKCKLVYLFTAASTENWVYLYDNKFLIAQTSMGAPAAAGLMEELGFMGITKFFACGSCGLINQNFDSSNLLLIDRAIRDEGTSYHYLPESVYVSTDKDLTNFLDNALKKMGFKFQHGTTWTCDAFFRETNQAINKRLSQGATSVEMECSAWASVAKLRGYQFAQILWFSDAVKQENWKWICDRRNLEISVIRLMLDILCDFVKNKL
ncbi:MAG: nucleoside phosphorylase [Christensenellales bacterium]